jgi:hypothetical protein
MSNGLLSNPVHERRSERSRHKIENERLDIFGMYVLYRLVSWIGSWRVNGWLVSHHQPHLVKSTPEPGLNLDVTRIGSAVRGSPDFPTNFWNLLKNRFKEMKTEARLWSQSETGKHSVFLIKEFTRDSYPETNKFMEMTEAGDEKNDSQH